MARMRAADAAVAIMQREGVKHAFGVPVPPSIPCMRQ